MQVAVLRATQQLSEVYSVMPIESLSELVPFFGFSEVEQIIVEAVKQGYLQVCHLPIPPRHPYKSDPPALLCQSLEACQFRYATAPDTFGITDLKHLQP